MKSIETLVKDSSDGPSPLLSLKKRHSIRKILLVGSGAVGKTSLVKVLKETQALSAMNSYVQEYHRTPFVELETITASSMLKKDIDGVFQVVDVAGQLDSQIHPLRDIARVALGGVDVVLLLFSTDNLQSLLDLARWINIMKAYYNGSRYDIPAMLLVRNKIDLTGTFDNALVEAVIQNDSDVVHYFEVSCLTGIGTYELSDWLVRNCFDTGSL